MPYKRKNYYIGFPLKKRTDFVDMHIHTYIYRYKVLRKRSLGLPFIYKSYGNLFEFDQVTAYSVYLKARSLPSIYYTLLLCYISFHQNVTSL